MVQWLGTLITLGRRPEFDSYHSNGGSQTPLSLVLGDPLYSSRFCKHLHAYRHTQTHTNTHKSKINFKKQIVSENKAKISLFWKSPPPHYILSLMLLLSSNSRTAATAATAVVAVVLNDPRRSCSSVYKHPPKSKCIFHGFMEHSSKNMERCLGFRQKESTGNVFKVSLDSSKVQKNQDGGCASVEYDIGGGQNPGLKREASTVKEQYKTKPSRFLLERTGYLGQNASFSAIFAVECGSPFPHVRESGSMCVAFLMVGCPFPLQGNKHLKLRQIGVLNRSEI